MLLKKNIVVAVSGGIAAYKSAEIVSWLVKKGANVKVIMTENACRFIAPLTFKTLSKNRVFLDTFDDTENEVAHIAIADQCDLFIIVPATANVIGKIANGIADDFLSTAVMAVKSPVMICPAMNVHMYENKIVRYNIKKLQNFGYQIVQPGIGRLACGYSGQGRLADLEDIYLNIQKVFTTQDLEGLNVLVTAGATREELDPVRFISNYSSGKMGFAIAERASLRGARVSLIHGQTDVEVPKGVAAVRVNSAQQMYEEVLQKFQDTHIVIKAAAVADFKPAEKSLNKIKKAENHCLELVKNIDILEELGRIKEKQILVGFAAETENLLKNAVSKLERKNLDLIVANDVTVLGSGFGTDNNLAKIIYPQGAVTELPMMSKIELADIILNEIKKIIGG